MATIQNFISNIDSYGGLARLNRFETIVISPFEANPDIESDRYTSFRVVSLTIPGKNLRTVPNENIYGPTHEMAQGLTYAEEITMSFYLSTEHRERQYFLNWIDMIVKPDTYNLEYYDNYKRDIDIYQLNRKDERTSGIKLIECYPKTLGALEYSQESGDIATIDVSFAFKEHYMIDSRGKEFDRQNIPRVST